MENVELACAVAQLTGYLNGMLIGGEIPAHHHAGLSELVTRVRRANGTIDQSAPLELFPETNAYGF